jgi:hypothetical protein
MVGSGRRWSCGRRRCYGLEGKLGVAVEAVGKGEAGWGPIYRRDEAVGRRPRRWPVRSAINGASAACARRGVRRGHQGRRLPRRGGLCEHRAPVRAARAGCGSGGRRGHARGSAHAARQGAGWGWGASDGLYGAAHGHALRVRVRRDTAGQGLARGAAGARARRGQGLARGRGEGRSGAHVRRRRGQPGAGARVREGREAAWLARRGAARRSCRSQAGGRKKGGKKGREKKEKGEKKWEGEKKGKRRKREREGRVSADCGGDRGWSTTRTHHSRAARGEKNRAGADRGEAVARGRQSPSGAGWDSGEEKRVRSLEIGLGQQLEPSVWSAKSSGGD